MLFDNSLLSSLLVTIQLLAGVQYVRAVCASGQMAVGRSSRVEQDSQTGGTTYYSGFLMANNCQIISANYQTQDKNELCKGGYNNGASVTCDGNHIPTGAVDTQNQHWNCYPTSDSSCNLGGGLGTYTVIVCCNRG